MTYFAEVEDGGVQTSTWMSRLDLASIRHVTSCSDLSDMRSFSIRFHLKCSYQQCLGIMEVSRAGNDDSRVNFTGEVTVEPVSVFREKVMMSKSSQTMEISVVLALLVE